MTYKLVDWGDTDAVTTLRVAESDETYKRRYFSSVLGNARYGRPVTIGSSTNSPVHQAWLQVNVPPWARGGCLGPTQTRRNQSAQYYNCILEIISDARR